MTQVRVAWKHPLGVSLVELLIVIAVFGSLIVGLTQKVGGPSSLESELAADVLAEELRSLRAKAMKEHRPTALVIPRTPEGYATGFYTLEGYGTPRIGRAKPLGNELKSVHLVAGTWATSSSFEAQESDSDLDLSTWNAPEPDDHIIAFTAAGKVVSNLPSLQDSTTLIVSTQVTLSEQSVGSQTYPRVDAAHKVACVRVNRTGLVQVISGFPDAAAVPSKAASTERPMQTALPAPTAFAGDSSPQFENIEVFPKRSPNLPADIEASVQVGQYLRLSTRANDADGGPLSIEWSAQRPTGKPGLGSFSFGEKVKMEWIDGAWHSVWEWSPPENVDAVVPEEFILKCQVTDAQGHMVESQLGSGVGKIWALRDGIVLYDTQRNGERTVMAVNSDGSEEREFFPGAALPAASPWGDCIALVAFYKGIYIVTRDGSQSTQIYTPVPPQKDIVSRVAWNPDGSMLCFCLRNFDADPASTVQEDVYTINADGSGLRLIAADFDVTSNQASTISWGFVGSAYDRSDLSQQFILFSPDHVPTNDQRTRRLSLVDGTEQAIGVSFSPGGASIGSASLSADCQKLVGLEYPSQQIVNYSLDPLTGRFENPVATGTYGIQPVYSFTGDRIVFTQVVQGQLEIGVMEYSGNNITTLSYGDEASQGPTWLLGGGLVE